MDGTVTIRDLNREFGWQLPDEHASTIAGLVLYEARRIPMVGQVFVFYGFRFEILTAAATRSPGCGWRRRFRDQAGRRSCRGNAGCGDRFRHHGDGEGAAEEARRRSHRSRGVSQDGAARELLHNRDFAFEGYRRADGHYDIEGRMTDRKSYAFPNDFRGEIAADEPLHDMRIRVTIDAEFRILDVVAETAAGPFEICPAITPAFAALKGARIGRGWSALLREKFGGVQGCTHHVELLRTLATVAFQTVYGGPMASTPAG